MQSTYQMSDLDIQMASFSYTHQTRYPMAASSRTYSGRIEKPRSQHNSPAAASRQRGYPMLRHGTPSQYNSSHSQIYPARRVTRPYSWGPTTASAFRAPATDYIISPATSSYTNTPAYRPFTSTPSQYTGIQATSTQKVYGDMIGCSGSTNRTSSFISASSCYSNASLSPPSPGWNQPKSETVMPCLTSASSTYSSPENPPAWHYSAQTQTQTQHTQHTQPHLYYSPLERTQQAQINDFPFAFAHANDYLLDRPPSPDLLWSGKKSDDDGEVLIALGLYDSPGTFDSPTAAPRMLKLAETWQPPKASAAKTCSSVDSAETSEAEEELDEDEEITFPKPEPGTSWFIQ